MEIRKGNLLEFDEGTIVQQVNCKGVMGAGLALAIRAKWPQVYNVYTEFLNDCEEFSIHPLGEIVVVAVDGTPEGRATKAVALFFAQDAYGTDKQYTDYDAFRNCLNGLKTLNVTIPEPLFFPEGIGCGLGGGDWKVISAMIEEVQPDSIIIRKE